MNISSAITLADSAPYLAEARALDSVGAAYLPATNVEVKHASGTETNYTRVKAGTVMAKAADGSVHPAGLAALSALSAGGDAIVTVGATHQAAYRIGDKVNVVSLRKNRTLSVVGEADTDALRSSVPHGLRVGDRFALSALTGGTGIAAGNFLVRALAAAPAALSVVGEADDETFTTTIAHGLRVGDAVVLSGLAGGSGAAEGSYVVATVPSTTTFTLTGCSYTTDITSGQVALVDRSLTDFTVSNEDGTQATFTTDITAGTVTFTADTQAVNLTGDRYITAINTATGAITLSGANITAAVGDYLIKPLAYKPCGILDRDVLTLEYGADRASTVAVAKTVPIRHEGTVRSGYVIGLSALAKLALSGAPYADPLDPTVTVQPECAGFLFRNL